MLDILEGEGGAGQRTEMALQFYHEIDTKSKSKNQEQRLLLLYIKSVNFVVKLKAQKLWSGSYPLSYCKQDSYVLS
jgi:hypothetical protein